MEKILMIKYGELTTKKGNRNLFVDTLYNNIVKKLDGLNYTIKKYRSRMYIISDNIKKIIEKLEEVFGIYEIDIVYKLDNKDIETIKNSIIEIYKDHDFKTFKVKTKRADKNYEIDSMEISRILGEELLKKYSDLKVNVKNPDKVINLEIREEGVFTEGSRVSLIDAYVNQKY